MAIKLTETEREALREFADQQGRQWRPCLLQMCNPEGSIKSWWGTKTRGEVLGPLFDRIGESGIRAIKPADLRG